MDEIQLTKEDVDFLLAVAVEVNRARKKYPQNRHMLTAMHEEVGEVAKAFLEHEFGNGLPGEIKLECVQVAAMALRCTNEGDSSFKYVPMSSGQGARDLGPFVNAMRAVLDERERQDKQWGGPSGDDNNRYNDWMRYVNKQLLTTTRQNFEERMVKIAALAIAAIESNRRKNGTEKS